MREHPVFQPGNRRIFSYVFCNCCQDPIGTEQTRFGQHSDGDKPLSDSGVRTLDRQDQRLHGAPPSWVTSC